MLAVAPPIKVFLSHSSADKTLARRLARDLQAANIEVWLDQWEIQVGEAFAQTITKGVEDATYVLVLLTPTSVTSHWVDREWRQKFQDEAKTQRFSIVPVRGEPCEIPDFLAQRSYADISGGSYPLGFRYLLEILRYHSDGQADGHSDGADLRIPANTSVETDAAAEGEDVLLVPMLPVVTPIALEVGVGLIPLFEPDEQGRSVAMDELIPRMRDRLQEKLGFPFPGIRIRGNDMDMPPYAVLIMIDEVPELLFEALPGYVVVDAEAEELTALGIAGQASVNVATGEACSVIEECDRPLAAANYDTQNAAEYIVQVLETLLQQMAAEFFLIDTTYGLVKPLEADQPDLVAKTVPKNISWYELTDVLRRLVEEGIGIGDMESILAGLSRHLFQDENKVHDTVVLAEKARQALSAQITDKVMQGRDALPVIKLSNEIENSIYQAIQQTSIGSYLALAPDITQEIIAAIRTTLQAFSDGKTIPVILTAWEIRRYVRKLVELEFPWLQVLSHQDLEASCPLQVLTVVQLEANQADIALESANVKGGSKA